MSGNVIYKLSTGIKFAVKLFQELSISESIIHNKFKVVYKYKSDIINQKQFSM